MATEMRKTGIGVMGDVPWGTHFCHFYETKDDLLDTLVPYFNAGLESQEFCMWVVSEPLTEEEARHALKQAVPDLDRYLADRSIEIVLASDWYLQGGTFDLKRVISGWNEKLARALARGYAGVRVTGNTAWLEKKDWKDFCEYEEAVNESIANQRLTVLCTYPLAASGAAEILDVARTHQFAIAKRHGSWEMIETPGLRQAKAEITRLNEELEQRVVERTSQLTAVNEELRKEITARKRAQEELRRSEAYLAEGQRLSHTGSWAWNVAAGENVFWSKEHFRIYGFDPAMATVPYQAARERIHPDDRPLFDQAFERAIRERADFELTHRMILPDGSVKYIHTLGHPVLDESGDLVEYIGTVMDVTERCRADEEREQLLARERAAHAEAEAAQHRFRDLVNSLEGIVWEADAGTFTFSFVSKQAERILGYPVERWLSEPTFWKDHIHPDDREWAVNFCVTATAEKKDHDFEYRMIAADGRTVWLRDLVAVVVEGDQATRLRGVIVDITERKQAEEALREQANLLNLTHDTVFVRDMHDVITYWNRGAAERYGWIRQEAVGTVTHQLTQTIFPAPLEEINAELLRTGRWEGELVHTKRDGTQVVVASRWALQRDEQGRPAAILETNNDITERKRAEAKLRDSERRYRNIFETAGVSIWEEDFSQVKAAIDELKAQGVRDFRQYLAAHPAFVRQAIAMVKIVDVNDATVTLFGAQSKDELLRSLHAIFTPETQDVFAGELVAIAEGRTSFASETVLQTLRGDKLTVLFTLTFPPQPATLDSVLVSLTDITERKRADEALRHTQAALAHLSRVMTMGELTASIAHEVNQPLAGVVTNGHACLRWLAREVPDLEEARAAVERIIRDGERASEVIRRIRAFSQKSDPQIARLDINDVIHEVLALVQSEVRKHRVALWTDLSPALPPVLGDRIQLQQVILNLLINGIEAMQTVTDRVRELQIRSYRHASDEVRVAVRDAGTGLDPENMARLFDAFFTTKPGGMGIGLSISRTIIEAHGGRLWATPHHGHGAAFQFILPVGNERML